MALAAPWNLAHDAHAAPAAGPAARSAASGDRIAGPPRRAAGARTRSEGLGIRDASPQPRKAPYAEGAVIVRPMTPVQESAAILMRLPPGKRIVHIAGFAGDITAYGDARAAASPGAAQPTGESDSGLQRGVERVRDRVLHRMRALRASTVKASSRTPDARSDRVLHRMRARRASGVRLDAFTVEHPASLPPGPFSDMVLAEAVDSAVLEVFPRAEAPNRSDGADSDGSGDAEDVAHAGDGEGSGAAADEARGAPGAETAKTGTAKPAAGGPAAASARAEVPHWESAMQERGIQWDRIMDDARHGAQLNSARRSR